jgi:hypothetical protein
MRPLYLLVTKDKFSLPLAVADSIEELAGMTNLQYSTLKTRFSRIYNGKGSKRSKYEVVWVDED